ncbi:transketolase [Thermoanaerobacterium thermosaccharolyticum]|uniref:Transketolase n=1 Tax=Thermoanaerobacterium thermosaccharolyticum TaxID=1517 RepID=A0A223HXD5_THETR|nr:transketolase [Thermoanaerobacterium thermosaccharolyticum]AST57102.1 transketolase [Thermoanaerobacterium thermosaccharolyticum]
MNDVLDLKIKATQIRLDLINMIYESKSGHIGGSLSSADILTVLYYNVMNVDPNNPNWEERDRFILSKGHSVEAYYSVLADKGYFPKEELNTYCKFGTRLIGHPNNKIPGVEMNTGALGHGLSIAVGMALGAKMDNKSFRVFTLMGDGELAEGSNWEAAMAASHYKLNNLIGIVDRNKLQISGNTEEVMSLEPLEDKWKSFGWDVLTTDGNDIEKLLDTFNAAIASANDKPKLILAYTTKGKGVKFIENKANWHHRVPTEEEYKAAISELQELMEVYLNEQNIK